MFQEMLAMASGGGSVKSGTVPNTSAAGETVTINTGLSNINKFVLIATPVLSSYSLYRFAVNWESKDSSYYESTCAFGNGAYGGYAIIGNYPSESYGKYTWKIQSISGGTITLNTPNSNANYGACKDIRWYAE